jgi:hypothetical protein
MSAVAAVSAMKQRIGSYLVTIVTDPAGPRNKPWVRDVTGDLADYIRTCIERERTIDAAAAKAAQRWFERAAEQARCRDETMPVINECQVDLYSEHGYRGERLAAIDVLKGTISVFAASEG